ncbi:MAG: alkaline phosphatase family protein [Solirubrobacteraceae bacterium]
MIDRAGHDHGPGSPEFAAGCKRSLDEVWEAVSELRGVTVLITADHGQVDVSPERVDYLDDLWPELPPLLTAGGVVAGRLLACALRARHDGHRRALGEARRPSRRSPRRGAL